MNTIARPGAWPMGQLQRVSLALTLLLASTADSAKAQEDMSAAPTGRLLNLSGNCESKVDSTGQWLPLKANAELAVGQRLRCLEGAEIRLRLPGSGAVISVRVFPSQEYVVPIGRFGATPSPETRGGRVAVAHDPIEPVSPALPQRGLATGGRLLVASAGIAKCAAPLGTVSFVEDTTSASYRQAIERGLGSPASVLRRYAQESNCFVVVDGQSERHSSISKQGSINKMGQRLSAAEFKINSSLDYRHEAAGGLGVLFGGAAVPGAVAGYSTQMKPTSRLVLFDTYSGVQVGTAEVSGGVVNPAALKRLLTSVPDSSVDLYWQSEEGLLAAAALAASFNLLVQQAVNYQTQKSVGQPPPGNAPQSDSPLPSPSEPTARPLPDDSTRQTP